MVKKKFVVLNYLMKKNVKRFGLFFAIALFFLILSKLSLSYRQNIKLNIELSGLEDDIIIENDTSNTLNVYVEAKGFTLLPYALNPSKIAKLNAKEDVKKEKNTYIFNTIQKRFLIEEAFGESFKIIQIKPDSVILPYTNLASKYIPILINSEIDYKTGFDSSSVLTTTVDSVKIVGPASILEQINQIETENLIKNTVNENISESVNLINPFPGKVKLFPKAINVTANIERFTEGTIEVPVKLINIPNGTTVNYFPKQIEVTYYLPLKDYKSTEASNFKIICDFKTVSANQSYIMPTLIQKPTFVKRASLKQHRVDFIKL